MNGRGLAEFSSTPWCLLHRGAKHDMKRASRFKHMEGAGIPAWPHDACSLSLIATFSHFSLQEPRQLKRGVAALACVPLQPRQLCMPTALVHPSCPIPCPASLGTRSLEVSLPRANRPWALHPHQALPSASKGCCTSAGGCSAARVPPLLEATTPVCVLDARVLTHRVLLSRSISLFPLPWPVAGTRL